MQAGARLAAAVFLLSSLTACLGGKDTSLPSESGRKEGLCEIPYSKTFEPIKIDGGHHVYFDSALLKILGNPDFDISEFALYVELESQKGENEDITIGINGITATRADGSKKFDKEGKARSGYQHVRLHGLKMNGGDPIALFLAKIYEKKGTLRLSLLGNIKIARAQLLIEGVTYVECPNPTPTPTPAPTPNPVPPTVSILNIAPAELLTSQTSISFAFEADQLGVNFYCSIDGGEGTVCSSPAQFSGLASGAHSFTVTARNSAGLDGSAAHQWTIDAKAEAVIIDPIASPSRATAADISFTAGEAGTFECSLDGGAFASCSSPFNAFGLIEGAHTFAVKFKDSLGNLSETAQLSWIVDSIAPGVQIINVTPAAGISSSLTRELQFTASESARFECSLDGAPFSDCASPVLLEALAEGNHIFEVRAIDAAGNVGVSASASWVTDLTPPQVTLGSVLPAAGDSNAAGFNVEFSSNESGHLLCSVDGAELAACTSPLGGAFAVDGAHSLTIVAEDVAGLRSSPVEVAWMIDRTSPEIRFGSLLPSSAAYISSPFFEASVVVPERVVLQAFLNDEELADAESPFSFPSLTDGSYHLVITGVDAFGNVTNSIEHRFTVDTVAPVATVSATVSGGAVTNRNANTITLSANEEATFQCELDGAGFSDCVSPLGVSGLIDGEHTLKVFARDLAGNSSPVESVVWTVDTVAPISQVFSTQIARDRFTFSFTSNESVSTFVCSVDGGAEFACDSPITMTFAAGSHVLKVIAIDPAGNREQASGGFTFFVRDPVKTFLNNPGIVYTNSRTMTFSFSSNHFDASFVCSVDGAAAVPCMAPFAATNLGDGVHTFKVRAVDTFGAVDPEGATYSWTVDTVAPVIVSTSTATASTSITVNWTVNELATGKLNWGVGFDSSRVTAETDFATSHSIRLSGLNPNTQYTVQITGRDRAGNVYTGPKFQIRTRF